MNLEVYDAVWLATAAMTYLTMKNSKEIELDDISFKQSDIQKYARNYTTKNVDSARISQWCNADHTDNTYNYLRDVNGKRRLSYPGEFSFVKERPQKWDHETITIFNLDSTSSSKIKVKELLDFLEQEYKPFVQKIEKVIDIDFSKITTHLMTYANERYVNPTKVAEQEREYYLQIRESGQQAVAELNKLSKFLEEKHFLHCPSKSKWLTGGNDVVRGYLWNQLKYADKFNKPTSISIFADKRNTQDDVRFRISIELDEKSASEEDYKRHHQILDQPYSIDENFCYYIKYQKDNDSYRTDMQREAIRQLLQVGEVTKVQLVYELYNEEIIAKGLTDEEIFQRLSNAFSYLKQFYDVVVKDENTVIEAPSEVEEDEGDVENEQMAKNLILYGPPGTGKTYNTALYALAIIEKKSLQELKQESYEAILERYKIYKEASQVQFTTFHQSYGYEEFIEGIKPVLNGEVTRDIQYEIAPGVFKQFCEQAQSLTVRTSQEQFEQDVRLWKVSIGGSGYNALKAQCFENSEIRIGWPDEDIELAQSEGYSNDSLYYFFEDMKKGDIVFSLGDQKHIDAIGIITSEAQKSTEGNEEFPHMRQVQWIATNIKERIYELNGHKNLVQQTIYELHRISMQAVNDIVQKYAKNSSTKIEKNTKNYVFIIDEINRGNISKILGELITLIEPTKRLGAKEAMTVTLPYSQEPFGVPENVYIIGTMNTADRSIALMDTALRRRFQFVEMLPDAQILEGIFVDKIDVQKMLETINKRIEVLYDREHTIGHAYFMNLKDDPSMDNLARIFENAILPLLQEYFYEDYSKIQLILGDNAKQDTHKFILDKQVQNIFKGNHDLDLPDYNYEIQREAFQMQESYIAIY